MSPKVSIAKVVEVIEPAKTRDIRVDCPECGLPNRITVSANAPPQKGVITCHDCQAVLRYEESSIEEGN